MFNEQDYIRLLKQLSDSNRNAIVLYYDEDDYNDTAVLQAMEAQVHACLVRHGKAYVRLNNHALSPEEIYAFSEGKRVYAVDGEVLKSALADDEGVYEAFIEKIREKEAYADFMNRSGLEVNSEDLISTTVVWAPETIDYAWVPEDTSPEEEETEEPPETEPEPVPEQKTDPAPAPEPENRPYTSFASPMSATEETREEDEDEPENDDDFLSRVMATDTSATVISANNTEVQEAEAENEEEPPYTPGKSAVAAAYEDCTEIDRTGLMQYYAAFTLKINDQIGKYELMAAPLNPKNPTGRFAFWVKKWHSGKAYVNVSEQTKEFREQGIYRFIQLKNGLYVTLTPEIYDGNFRVRLEISDKEKGTIEIRHESSIGKEGHIIFADSETDTAIHAFPVDMKNNSEGNAGYYYVVESKDGATAGDCEDGIGRIRTKDGSYRMTLRWHNETLYAQLT